MRKTYAVILIVIAMLFLTSTANAFDGKRKGFLLGLGMGAGFNSFTEESVDYNSYYGRFQKTKSPRENKGSFITDFKIGYSPTDFWEIYYTTKLSWLHYTTLYEGEKGVVSGLGALGITYYFEPQAPSFFVTGGMGVSMWGRFAVNLFGGSGRKFADIGFGLFAGAGYEFKKHLNVGLNLVWGKPGDTEAGIPFNVDILSVQLTLNALGY